jgi:hypothetical protein
MKDVGTRRAQLRCNDREEFLMKNILCLLVLLTGAASVLLAQTEINGSRLIRGSLTNAGPMNYTVGSSVNTHTVGWSDQLAISRGGTGASTAAAAIQTLRDPSFR